jgi:short subunit dehydrogenase-like uncharacterized protein
MITLIGATGFTGRLVAKELAGRNVKVRLAARDKRKMAELLVAIDRQFDCVSIDIANANSYEAVLEGTDVVINCAGPFSDLGEPVLRETLARGIHYLDTTGEQGFIKLAFDKYGGLARETGSILAPACGFEYAMADAAAAMLSDRIKNCESLEIIYFMHRITTSRGTKKSVIRALGAEQLELRNGKLVPLARGKVTSVRLPGEGLKNAFPFPGGEPFLLPLHLPVHSLDTLMASDMPSALLKFLSYAGSFCATSKLAALLNRLIDTGPLSPTEQKRVSTAYSIHCRNRVGDSVTVKGYDPYLLTAIIISDLACHLDSAEQNKPPSGPVSPSMVAGYQRIVDITTRAGAVWE